MAEARPLVVDADQAGVDQVCQRSPGQLATVRAAPGEAAVGQYLHHAQECRPQFGPLIAAQPPVELVGGDRHRPVDTAGGLVPAERQGLALPGQPCLPQRVGEPR